jgi:hypothetical protein
VRGGRLIDGSVAVIPERSRTYQSTALWKNQAGSTVRKGTAAFNLAEAAVGLRGWAASDGVTAVWAARLDPGQTVSELASKRCEKKPHPAMRARRGPRTYPVSPRLRDERRRWCVAADVSSVICGHLPASVAPAHWRRLCKRSST